MSRQIDINSATDASLKACAAKLGISEQEALERAVARMHLALFQDSSADADAVDFTQSLPPDTTDSTAAVASLPGLDS